MQRYPVHDRRHRKFADTVVEVIAAGRLSRHPASPPTASGWIPPRSADPPSSSGRAGPEGIQACCEALRDATSRPPPALRQYSLHVPKSSGQFPRNRRRNSSASSGNSPCRRRNRLASASNSRPRHDLSHASESSRASQRRHGQPKRLPGQGDFIFAQGRTMTTLGTLLIGAPLTDHGFAADQCRARGFRLRRTNAASIAAGHDHRPRESPATHTPQTAWAVSSVNQPSTSPSMEMPLSS